ncbi:MAG TPA: biopolymer transporter ExbD [Myxococcaceae bacterium]|nr:biopolymer transporter ExbD [Myxococcaceae bacterium]
MARKKTVVPQGEPNTDINVTPLVDVVLVLLIIFMVVTPLLEKDIEVKVPPSETAEEVTEVPEGQLVVSVDAAGKLSINTEVIPLEEYQARLKRMLAAKPRGEKLVFFMPSDQANYGTLVAALDGARAAGAETLGMVTELPETPAAAPAAPAPAPAE